MRRRWYRFSTPSNPRRRNIATIIADVRSIPRHVLEHYARDAIRPPRVHQARLREPNQHVSCNTRVQAHSRRRSR